MALGYDNYATSFQSLMSPMGNIQANYNTNGYGNQRAGGMMGGYGGYGGYVTDPLMNQKNVDNVIAGDQYRNNYYGRPIPAHKKQDNLPVMLGILGTALGTAALALAAYKFKGKKLPVIPPSTGGAGAGGVVKPKTIRVTQGKPPYAPSHINVDPSTLKYVPTAKATGVKTPKTMTVTQGKPPYAPSHINVDPSTLKYAPTAKATGVKTPKTITVTQGKPPYALSHINVDPSTLKYVPTATVTGVKTPKTMTVTQEIPPYAPSHINVDPSTLKYAPASIGTAVRPVTGSSADGNPEAKAALGNLIGSLQNNVNQNINTILGAAGKGKTMPTEIKPFIKATLTPEAQAIYNKHQAMSQGNANNWRDIIPQNQSNPKALINQRQQIGEHSLRQKELNNIFKNYDAEQVYSSVKANNQILAVKPEMARQGKVVYTTATPEQIAKANSIGEIATFKPLKSKPVKTQPKLNAQQLAAQQIAQHNNAVLAPIGLKINAKNLNKMKNLSPELYNEFITKFNTIAANKQTNALKALTMDARFENLFKLA